MEDRIKGGIIGAAIGDALGMPTENISVYELEALYGGKVTGYVKPAPYHPCSHLEPGQWTDDTQQILILAQNLIDNRGFEMKSFCREMAEWARKCKYVPGYNRFAGGVSLNGATNLYKGVDFSESGSLTTKSCGNAMRIAPIGFFYDNMEDMLSAVDESSKPTHNSTIAKDGARVIAGTLYWLMQERGPRESVEEALRTVSDEEIMANVEKVLTRSKENPYGLGEEIGKAGYVTTAVPLALHCFLHSPEDFRMTVLNGANMVKGDTDTIACMAGALSGTYNGYGRIPKELLVGLERREKLEQIAEELFKARK